MPSTAEGVPIAPHDVLAIEAAVGVVPGVTRAVVTRRPDGEPEVLRVVLCEDADPLDVARAADRILRLQFGVGLDPQRVEIVEGVANLEPDESEAVLRLVGDIGALNPGEDVRALLEDLDPGPGPRFGTDVLASAARHPAGVSQETRPPAPRRPVPDEQVAVAELAPSADGLGATATVSITRGGVVHSGSAEGPTTQAALNRSIASATLRALTLSIGSTVRLDVDAVALVAVGDSKAAVVRVIWQTADATEHLTGAAEVLDDPRHAVIRATLGAVNQRLRLDVEA